MREVELGEDGGGRGRTRRHRCLPPFRGLARQGRNGLTARLCPRRVHRRGYESVLQTCGEFAFFSVLPYLSIYLSIYLSLDFMVRSLGQERHFFVPGHSFASPVPGRARDERVALARHLSPVHSHSLVEQSDCPLELSSS